MDEDLNKDRVAKVLEIADRVHDQGTVYERLPTQEVARKRSFSALTAPKAPLLRTEDAVDMNRTYGF